jgi:hypothetical protein
MRTEPFPQFRKISTDETRARGSHRPMDPGLEPIVGQPLEHIIGEEFLMDGQV